MRRLAALAMLCGIGPLAAGCGSTPATHFYALSSAGVPASPSSTRSVAVGPVSVPAVVDRPQIAISTGPNQVWLDEFHQWAAPLQNDIARVVAENLVTMLGTPRVTFFSQTLLAEPDYRVVIEVQRFASAPGEAATLDAVWTVSRGADGKSQTGRTSVREPTAGSSYEALAAAHSRAVARMSQDIADAVGALDRPRS
ncbi:MAG TPA: PqiC family protein [Candidatus Methylomirabilis sp.]|nr:PqiC family protein [Candidatus Methylomirabilis sp.]